MSRNITVAVVGVAAMCVIALLPGYGDDRSVLTGNHPVDAAKFAVLGRADPNLRLTMQVRFAVRNRAMLEQLLEDQHDPASPQYRKWLKTGEFDARFGARPADIAAAQKWLESEGFAVVTANPGFVKFTGTVSQAAHAFDVDFATYGAGNVYANTRDPAIPRRFEGVIASVEGLDNMVAAVPASPHDHLRPVPLMSLSRGIEKPRMLAFSGSGSSGGETASASPGITINNETAFGPQDLRTFYDESVGTGSDGAGQCIAIMGVSDVNDPTMALFASQFSLPSFNLTRVVPSGGANPGIVASNSFELEAELDVEYSHAVAPGAPQKLYLDTGNLGTALLNDITAAVTDDTCSAINLSFILCSSSTSFFSMSLDSEFVKAAAQGQSVFVSAGDQGAAGIQYDAMQNTCVTGTTQNVNEMSADPNVSSVGGTQFTPNYDQNGNDVGYATEDVWNANNGSTGGGASQVFTKKPIYQTGPGVPADGVRDVPDIALIAGQPGVFIADDKGGGTATISCCGGGTSLAAPLWAGFSRVISEQLGTRVGPMNPTIYQLANQQYGAQQIANGFHDVTSGNNTFDGVIGFSAGPGFDQTTGWGTIDFNVFAAAVKSAAPTATATATATATRTATPTATATSTSSMSPSATATSTRTSTPTNTATATATPSSTASPTTSNTATATASATMSATSTPTASASGTLTATATATTTPTATLTPTPTPTATTVPVALKVSRSSINFGKVRVGRGKVITLTLSNPAKKGGPAITFVPPLALVEVTNPQEFGFPRSGGTNCPAQLLPKKKCELFLEYVPASPGQRFNLLTIFDNAANANQGISLQGIGR